MEFVGVGAGGDGGGRSDELGDLIEYAPRLRDQTLPLTGLIDPDLLINGGRNTIAHEKDPVIQAAINMLFATGLFLARKEIGISCLSHLNLSFRQ